MTITENLKSNFHLLFFFSTILFFLCSCDEKNAGSHIGDRENSKDQISKKFDDSYFEERELYLAKWEKYSEKEKKENARAHKMFLRNDAYWYPRLQGGSGSIKEYNYKLAKILSTNLNILQSIQDSPCTYWKPIGVQTTNYNRFTGVGRVGKVSFHSNYNAEYSKGTTPPNWDIGANTFFASSPTGGLWKTEDGGGKWNNLGTDFLPFLGVTDFEVSNKNSDEMYIITSTKTDKSFANEGKKGSLAIFRTMDGGKKWESSGAPFSANWTTYSSNKQYLNDLEIVENVANGLPDFILTASEFGIHKSIDHGQTWQRKQVGFGQNCSLGDATLEIDNMDKTRAYVSTQIEWKDGAQNSWDADSIYYSSTSGQFWKTWKTINKHGCDPSQLSLGVPVNTRAYISGNKVLVSPTNSDVIYVVVHCYFRDSYSPTSGACIPNVTQSETLTYLFKSTNRGGTWSREMCATVDGAGAHSHIGKYIINPTDDSRIHLMRSRGTNSYNMAHWDDATKNFISDTPPNHMHADLQFLEFKTVRKCGVDKLYALTGTDGGVNLCEVNGSNLSISGGNIWSNVTGAGLQIGQIYNHSSSTNSKFLTFGSLDNGSWVRNGFGLNDWKVSLLGDGMDCVYDYADDQVYYNMDNQSSGRLTKNNPAAISSNPSSIKPITAGGLEWLAPIEIDPQNHASILVGYHSSIYKSNATPITSASWTPITVTPMLNKNRKVSQIAIDPTNSDIMFASSNWQFTYTNSGTTTKGARLFKTTDGGQNWTPSGQKWYRFITGIAIAPNGQDMYVSMSGNRWNGSPENVMRSTDQGVTWENWNENLPDFPVNCVLVNRFTNEVFIGTDYGVYRRKKTDKKWTKVGCGLPNVIVTDLSIVKGKTKETILRASTFGRGMWEMELSPGLNVTLQGNHK